MQGDERGYVKKGIILGKDKDLHQANVSQQKMPAVSLNDKQQEIVRKAIELEAKTLGQKIHGLTVCPQHVHLVADDIELPVGKAVSHYKNAARLALRAQGHNGRIWTRGFDKRYCFTSRELQNRIAYIQKHNQ